MDTDSKGQRKMENSGGGLLPAVEGHSTEYRKELFCPSLRREIWAVHKTTEVTDGSGG